MKVHQHSDYTLEKLLALRQSRPVVVLYEGLYERGPIQRTNAVRIRHKIEEFATLYDQQAIFARINIDENPSWNGPGMFVPLVGIWRNSVEQCRTSNLDKLESDIQYQISLARSK